MVEKKFYVYVKTYPDGKIFYVGKGSGDRINAHEKEAISGKTTNPHKINVIRKIWAAGGEVGSEKVFETDDEEAAYEIERALIESIGLSNLTNICDGGDGPRFNSNPEYLLKQREAASRACAKTWDGFVDPWGNRYPDIVNLFQFCIEHNLGYYGMIRVANGEADNYRGWRNIDEPCYFDTEQYQELPGWLFGIYGDVDNMTSLCYS